MTNERPIPLDKDMVRAILAGTMTQTQRVISPQPNADYITHAGGTLPEWVPVKDGRSASRGIMCPFGGPGDLLWGRETWGMSYVDLAADRPHTRGGEWGSPSRPRRAQCVVYRADCDAMPVDHEGETARWSPSIHMPRWASRITLRVTSVRVERMNGVVEEGASGSWVWVIGFEQVTP